MDHHNDTLFFKLWKNKYINRIIFNHLKLFNIFYQWRQFSSLQSLIEFKYKYYLNEIDINFSVDHQDCLESILPTNITKISNTDYSSNFNLKSIPPFIESLYITQNDIPIFKLLNKSSIKYLTIVYSSKKKTSYLNGNEGLIEIVKDSLPDTLIELTLIRYPFKIKKDTINNTSLKKLVVDGYCEVELQSLPESLENLKLGDDQSNPIKLEPDLFPNNLKELSLYCNPYVRYVIPDNFEFPDQLVRLEITCDDSSTIAAIPPNLQSIEIESKKLNQSMLLTKLKSRNIKSLTLNTREILDINGKSILPNSLEYLNFKYMGSLNYNQQLLLNHLPPTLKHLCFDLNSNFTTSTYGFNNGGYPLIKNEMVFPSSLTYINFGDSFNTSIGVGVLPSGLKRLILGEIFNKEIIQDSIPYNLELLKIRNRYYDKTIKLNNPYTLVDSSKYYRQFEKDTEGLRTFKVPSDYTRSLELLFLSNKVNLEYLDMSSFVYNETFVPGRDIPLNNNIKTLALCYPFSDTIDLEVFQNLEHLIINDAQAKIVTSTYDQYHNENNKKQDYNFYKLKKITTLSTNSIFLDQLDEIFYQFIKLI
ncbi:hypothetical protein DICPUDRAFT_76021 [Dictyostelium purpureum]|uniref:FNIP repeat-containing protein n=1 Tax=Dictyostelium purpureum TaxID=5786 RepID=F0ZCC9_DICPU|nr:uncharacterized protein DICPUDRAFT_76021 [Dictyostelium purpureum]EGC38400.1 hypothetical protein DICPUDRAFT_76021 [Dictyostelium purpureum]|eukprot:XP_003285061.1 hypothetical protein DICPUDRAFT_76021 [Dictyostelium purpureum]